LLLLCGHYYRSARLAKSNGGPGVLLERHEGPAGWRSVIATPEAGKVALWYRKDCRQ
jgi:hypothetical protein